MNPIVFSALVKWDFFSFSLAGCLQSLVAVVNNLACFPTVPERAVNPLCLGTVPVGREELCCLGSSTGNFRPADLTQLQKIK